MGTEQGERLTADTGRAAFAAAVGGLCDGGHCDVWNGFVWLMDGGG